MGDPNWLGFRFDLLLCMRWGLSAPKLNADLEAQALPAPLATQSHFSSEFGDACWVSDLCSTLAGSRA